MGQQGLMVERSGTRQLVTRNSELWLELHISGKEQAEISTQISANEEGTSPIYSI